MPPKTASQTPNDDLDTEIALFRYGLIAQILHDPPPVGQQETLLRAIAAKCYRIPGSTRTQVSTVTLHRYLRAYRRAASRRCGRRGGAMPACRGRCRPQYSPGLSHCARSNPPRTTQTLVDILQRDASLTLAHPINVHTLTTHLRRCGKTRRLLAQRPTAYRRFERDQVNALWQGDALVGPWLPDPGQAGKQRRGTCFASSTTIAVWYLTPNSSSTRRCPAWNASSSSLSCAAACRRRSMWTTATSMPPPSSAPPPRRWASAASTRYDVPFKFTGKLGKIVIDLK